MLFLIKNRQNFALSSIYCNLCGQLHYFFAVQRFGIMYTNFVVKVEKKYSELFVDVEKHMERRKFQYKFVI